MRNIIFLFIGLFSLNMFAVAKIECQPTSENVNERCRLELKKSQNNSWSFFLYKKNWKNEERIVFSEKTLNCQFHERNNLIFDCKNQLPDFFNADIKSFFRNIESLHENKEEVKFEISYGNPGMCGDLEYAPSSCQVK